MPNSAVTESDSRAVKAWRLVLSGAADRLEPVVDICRPYVDGLANLPTDGRFLLVGNHTAFSFAEIFMIPFFVRKAIGSRVRPLADRQFEKIRGPQADLIAAYGAVIGRPEAAAELMRNNETILVFPGGGREITKFKGEEYALRWDNRYGFARLAVEHQYPIIPVGLVGGDDVYTAISSREGWWGRFSNRLTTRLSGRADMAIPLVKGVGPTLIPQPQRMYLRFGSPIDTASRGSASVDAFVSTIRDRAQTDLAGILTDLQRIRSDDPYRQLNPLAWRSAVMPS